MTLFKKHKPTLTSSETKLNTIIDLIKDLPRSDYNRLKDGMDLIYNGYQKIRNARTLDEKELDEITNIEKSLEVEKWVVEQN